MVKMTREQFKKWSQDNKWFFDVLAEQAESVQMSIDASLDRFVTSPFTVNDSVKEALLVNKGQLHVLKNITNLQYEDLFDDQASDEQTSY